MMVTTIKSALQKPLSLADALRCRVAGGLDVSRVALGLKLGDAAVGIAADLRKRLKPIVTLKPIVAPLSFKSGIGFGIKLTRGAIATPLPTAESVPAAQRVGSIGIGGAAEHERRAAGLLSLGLTCRDVAGELAAELRQRLTPIVTLKPIIASLSPERGIGIEPKSACAALFGLLPSPLSLGGRVFSSVRWRRGLVVGAASPLSFRSDMSGATWNSAGLGAQVQAWASRVPSRAARVPGSVGAGSFQLGARLAVRRAFFHIDRPTERPIRKG